MEKYSSVEIKLFHRNISFLKKVTQEKYKIYLKTKSVFLWDFNVKPKLTAWKQMCDHARNKCVQHSFQSKSYYLGLKLIFVCAWLAWWIGILPENVQEYAPKLYELFEVKKYLIYYPSISPFLLKTSACIGTFSRYL